MFASEAIKPEIFCENLSQNAYKMRIVELVSQKKLRVFCGKRCLQSLTRSNFLGSLYYFEVPYTNFY